MLVAETLTTFLQKEGISTRPKASHGLWLMFLLPSAVITSYINHQVITTPTYVLSVLFSLGLAASCLVFIYCCCYCHGQSKALQMLLHTGLTVTALIVAVLIRFSSHRGIAFSIWSGFMCTMVYHRIFVFSLKKLQRCFTPGEAAIVSQGFVLFLYHAFTNIHEKMHYAKTPSTVMQKSTLVIQVGLLAVILVAYLAYKCRIRSPTIFYATFLSVAGFFLLFLLKSLLRTDPFIWIGGLILEDFYASRIVLYWSFCSALAVIIINVQIKGQKKASTSLRKIFHVLAVVTFVPGLLTNCSFLYLASGVVLGIFLFLELLRILQMPPLATALQQGLYAYVDEKDSGILALTPIYLLAGVSVPLWLHPAPCDVTNSAGFQLLPLLSGLLAIGVGDTAASVVGSKVGRHRWGRNNESNRTIEGTIACVISQFLFVALLVNLGYLRLSVFQMVKTVIAVIVISIIEAKTDQVDNLVLPLVMYVILI